MAVTSEAHVIIGLVQYHIQPRTLSIIRWILENESRLPLVGHLQFNLNVPRGTCTPQVLCIDKPFEIDSSGGG